MEDLKKKRDELKTKYERMMAAHSKNAHISNEGAYQDSANSVKAIYEELYQVSLAIGDPVPKWF